MKNHYVPQNYLKGFSHALGNQLWAYDRKEKCNFKANVLDLAHENNFYSGKLEKKLAEEFDGPASKVLNKIRNKKELTQEDKILLSLYLLALRKRGPAGKARIHAQMSEVSLKVGHNFHAQIDQVIFQEPEFGEMGLKIKEKVNEILAKFVNNPPDGIFHDVVAIDSIPQLVAQIVQMTWKFFYSPQPMAFLTCDNPVFFFEELGIGNPNSELSVPITSEIALWATNRKDLSHEYFPVTNSVIKELNRRTVSNSTRFVYSGVDQPWIASFVFKGAWKLNRMNSISQ